MTQQITSDLVIARLLDEGEWWYALALFSDSDLAALLTAMGIENSHTVERTKVVYALSQRLAESGKHIDTLRDYFNDHFLKPNNIPTHKSELWFNFNDCESLVTQNIISAEFNTNVDPQIHKDRVLDALTLEQLRDLYTINGNEPQEEDREWLIEALNGMDFAEEYDSFLRNSGELSNVQTEHESIIEFLFGAQVQTEEEETE